MQIHATSTIKPNYKFTKATPEILAKILCEVFYLKETKHNIETFIARLANPKDRLCVFLSKMLRTYEGQFLFALGIHETHNIIPQVLRYQLATLLTGTAVASTFNANYIALGSGSGTPAATDTTLVTEELRGTFSNRYRVDEIAYLDKFFTTTEVAGNTYLEAWVFCDGTGSADSGYLLSRTEMSEAISANETLTINVAITISSAT
jgi:hypothetical protein